MENIFKKPWAWILIIGLTVAGVILYTNSDVFKKEEDVALRVNESDVFKKEEDVALRANDSEDVALRVNERVFTNEEFQGLLDDMIEYYKGQGAELTAEEAKEQTIKTAIQQALLIQHAEDMGFTASKEEIDQWLNNFMASSDIDIDNEEDLLNELKERGVQTRKHAEKIIEMEIKVEKLVAFYVEEMEVSEEDILDVYNSYKNQAEGAGEVVVPLDDLREDIKKMLAEEQVTPLLLSKVDTMKEEAEIYIFVK